MARRKKGEEEKRDERVNLRLTIAERVALEESARACGIGPTDYARRRTLGLPVAPRVQADPSIVIALNRIGVNINQIAKVLNSGGQIPPAELQTILHRLNETLDDMQDISAPRLVHEAL